MINKSLTLDNLKVNHKVNHEEKEIGNKLIIKIIITIQTIVWGACGRWFESSHPDIGKALIIERLSVLFSLYAPSLASHTAHHAQARTNRRKDGDEGLNHNFPNITFFHSSFV